mgnify:CR=1 FL=1
MKITVSVCEVARMLKEDKWARWTDEGAFAIARYLDDLEDQLGEEYEVDVTGIRGEFAEYRNEYDLVSDTGKTADTHEKNGTLLARLKNGGFVIRVE